MRDVTELVEGYRRFRRIRYPEQAALYRVLAEQGQTPATMVVACCDSRVDPATIFDAGPGQLFVVRNVANLVPPCEPAGDYHGTSAAIEFAVTGLGVSRILVLGHGRCGGVQAYLERFHGRSRGGGFVGNWMSIMAPAAHRVLGEAIEETPDERQRRLEQACIRQSIDNLATFAFVRDRVAAGTLELHGAWFSIAEGELLALDRGSGRFDRVD